MCEFVTNSSQAVSIGASAVKVSLASFVVPAGGQVMPRARKGKYIRINNYHATQLLYWSVNNAVAITVANAQGVVAPGKYCIIRVPETTTPTANADNDTLQMIASGATTTGTVELGGFPGSQ